MHHQKFKFRHKTVNYFFGTGFMHLNKLTSVKGSVIITDENIFQLHKKKLKGWNTIVLKPGEQYKIQTTVDSVVEQLITLNADRQTTLVGVGGGVVTDITGYVASVFMRGINFGFVPTTLLGMVDAAIGGKNGINYDIYKNVIGAINQPQFLLYDVSFLPTLPRKEWWNGFAEIIKHAAIKDATMFKELEQHSLKYYQKNKTALQKLIRRNALLKTKTVQQDEFESGDRRLLNFGHTLGHALEKQYNLLHGEAVSIGIAFAAKLSEKFTSFRQGHRVISLLEKYHLPVEANYHKRKVLEALVADKKRDSEVINFVLLEKIGKGIVQKISLEKLYKFL
ncbi:MAG: 3-dehydroquinate synthase [Chitinophagaceae bacterium]